MKSGTESGTAARSRTAERKRNAERGKPAPMLAFQRNGIWNETRIPTLERSTTPLGVERAERNQAPSHSRLTYRKETRRWTFNS